MTAVICQGNNTKKGKKGNSVATLRIATLSELCHGFRNLKFITFPGKAFARIGQAELDDAACLTK